MVCAHGSILFECATVYGFKGAIPGVRAKYTLTALYYCDAHILTY